VTTDPTRKKSKNTRRRPWPAALFFLPAAAVALAAIAVAVWPAGDSGEPPAGKPLPPEALAAEQSDDPAPVPPRGEGTKKQLVNLVARDASPPRRIAIPAIGVSANVVPLGREPDGTMQTPQKWQNAGWYRPGPEPGERGPAVIVGHVDSTAGPAVFYRLRELNRGNLITIRRADGSALSFRVEGLERWPKSKFPTQRVYGKKTRLSVLRIVTCSGDFDESTGHYVDNTIVYAVRVPARRRVPAQS
jgi:hypothetical protein